jgi:two-component system phosphate regulon response regulator PhoB
MTKQKYWVLVVEDDPDLLEIVKTNLEELGYQVLEAMDGRKACELAVSHQPHLILLDMMLPKMQGMEVLQFLKRNNQTEHIPTIIISAKDDENTVVKALEEGADDYITKPCGPREMVARIKAVLRRQASEEGSSEQIRVSGDLRVDFQKHEVRMQDEIVALTKTEFDILWSFMRDHNQVFTRKQLLQIIHGPGVHTLDRNIDVHVVSLRKKLKDHGQKIETVRGVGYRMNF